jgi:predicted nucleic acid-binding protein
MTGNDDVPGTVVFNAEPLVAYFCDEPGSEVVEQYIRAAEGATDGFISAVNLAELYYIVRAIDTESRAETVIEVLTESGIDRVDTDETWSHAAEFKFHRSVALGDAFALGTARHVGGTLLVGADDDYDEITSVQIDRFRNDPA